MPNMAKIHALLSHMLGARSNVTQYQNVSQNISTQGKCLAFRISTVTLTRL